MADPQPERRAFQTADPPQPNGAASRDEGEALEVGLEPTPAPADVESAGSAWGLAYAIASQEVLARDWLTPEDDIDWSAWVILDEDEP